MRIVTIDIPVYTFDELEDDVKQKVIEDNRQVIHPNYIFNEDCKKEITDKGFEIDNLYYTLGYQQGDGLSFDGKIPIINIRNNIELWNKLISKINIQFLNNVSECCNYITITKMSYLRQHCRTIILALDNSHWCDYETYEDFINIIKSYYESVCSKLESNGYRYFYEIPISIGKEWADSNSYEFTKDGTVFNQST